MKATEQYFPVMLFIILYKLVLSFESAHKILSRQVLLFLIFFVYWCSSFFSSFCFSKVRLSKSQSRSHKVLDLRDNICAKTHTKLQADLTRFQLTYIFPGSF